MKIALSRLLIGSKLVWFTVGFTVALISQFIWRDLFVQQFPISCSVKPMDDKNHCDFPASREEQDERHRVAETMDIEINRWAEGKEGNLRALLSTLQYVVLWPECGWEPVSLADLNLITGDAIKKVYRKATLCIHPDRKPGTSLSLRSILMPD
ncbi:hypothetical protein ACFE04_030349 [Oxalis oulophora]